MARAQIDGKKRTLSAAGRPQTPFQNLSMVEEKRLNNKYMPDDVDHTEETFRSGEQTSISHAIHFDIFTLFPQMFLGPFSESILKRAQEKGRISIALHDIRNYTTDRHHVCDDAPYGGGGGMIMKPEPIVRAVETVLAQPAGWTLPTTDAFPVLPPWDVNQAVPLPENTPIILMAPQGRTLNQAIVAELSQQTRIALICGRYEGIDERVRTHLITDEISIGDYVLSGGELAAMVIVDAVARLVPGVLGYALSAHQDSHSPGLSGLLEGPQYTRPLVFRNEAAPDVLLSGHHGKIERWRRCQALLRTLTRRPQLLDELSLGDDDRAFLRVHGWQPDSRQQ
jgi:tRNA (guanine37-N1)-methyltransferase